MSGGIRSAMAVVVSGSLIRPGIFRQASGTPAMEDGGGGD